MSPRLRAEIRNALLDMASGRWDINETEEHIIDLIDDYTEDMIADIIDPMGER